jgi:hypothetical protein
MATRPYTPTPKNPAAYPPEGYVAAHRVKTGENWWTLQTKYKRANVWDLILFNFDTSDPDEVNWFLANKVGCQLTTPDRKNYRFSSAASPGLIYIPPATWGPGKKGEPTAPPGADPNRPMSGDDLSAKAGVVAVLNNLPVFRFFLTTTDEVSSERLRARVLPAILGDRIKVRYVPNEKGIARYYPQPGRNELEVPWPTPSDEHDKALVVHECVHALMDYDGLGELLDQHSEAAGYIAQMWYLHKTLPEFKKVCVGVGPIHRAAWAVAKEIESRRKAIPPVWRDYLVSQLLYWRVLGAVRSDPDYRPYADDPTGYDGIPS